ncbi:unnamed protein product [Bursaphelenchus okinawaensis]|uniref:Homeobox domain-containing protein n=1 Tax=Bursaphelenchus okinawaensis TaxID=465554 RepID=A0A811KSY7_9BILA|nr:unnamed protein product [Bursaphelenchus okinawaensis]CAG9110277.1 unnamed protein product [Bursaphelenchus okinawaensis]
MAECETHVPEYCQVYEVLTNDGSTKRYLFPKALDLSRPKRPRTTFSTDQLKVLESEFQKNPYLVGTERSQLAKRLNLKEVQVKVWFQNRRTKTKKGDGNEAKSPKPIEPPVQPMVSQPNFAQNSPEQLQTMPNQPLFLNIPPNYLQNPFFPPDFNRFYVDFLR